MADLSRYYIIKKFRHGWLLGKVENDESQFISREELVKMGFLADTGDYSSASMLGSSPPSVIVVPTSPSSVQKRSQSSDKNKYRNDNNSDWRRNGDDPF